MSRRARVVEGYLYMYPYVGNDLFVYPEKIDDRDWRELTRIHMEATAGSMGISLLEVLGELVGEKVRVVVEPGKITVEVVE